MNAEDYVHRIGRTGRAGRSGRAFTLVSPEDGKLLAAVESMLGKPIDEIELPDIATADMSEGDHRGRGRGRNAGGRGRGRNDRNDRSDRNDRNDNPQPQDASDTDDLAEAPRQSRRGNDGRNNDGRNNDRRHDDRRNDDRRDDDRRGNDHGGHRRNRRDDHEDTGLGFGDNEVPAFFLQRSIAPQPTIEAD